MYKIPKRTATSIEKNESIEGEPIEMQIQRMTNNGEVLGEEKQMIYTKPSEGVLYGTNIRDDRQEKAIEMTENVAADVMRRREWQKNKIQLRKISSLTTDLFPKNHEEIE